MSATGLLPLITAAIGLLTTNKAGQERKNLRVVKRTYKQLKKEFGKDGLDDEEKEMLKQLKQAIVKRTLELG